MKKILAGVLAAASMLTMTVGASAAATTTTDKPIKAAGEVEYEVAVTAPKVVLDLILPAKITAALNPYGADLVLKAESAANANDAVTTNAGIASVAYTITNNSVAYGVYLDATAKTTTSSKNIVVKNAAPTANTKEAQLVLAGAADADGLKAIADADLPTASAAFADPTQGVLVLDSTAEANTAAGLAAGQTKMKKFMFIPAAAPGANAGDPATPSTAAMGFLGKLGTGDDVEWGEEDAINVALILKVVAGPKGAPAGGAGGGGTSTVTPGLNADLTQTNFTGTGITAFAKKAGANNEYNITVDSTTNGGTPIGLNLTGLVDNAQTVTSKTADNANVTTGGMGMNVTITPANTGSSVVTITLSDSKTIVLNFTIT